MSSDQDRMRLIDVTAGVDVGQGYRLAWSVGPDGDAWPILADDRQSEPVSLAHQPRHFQAIAPHELNGRLPDEFQQFRCGGLTRTRTQCRTVVDGPGKHCRHHTETSAPEGSDVDARAAQSSRWSQAALFDLDEHGDVR